MAITLTGEKRAAEISADRPTYQAVAPLDTKGLETGLNAFQTRMDEIVQTEGKIDGINLYNEQKQRKDLEFQDWDVNTQHMSIPERLADLKRRLEYIDANPSRKPINAYADQYIRTNTPGANETYFHSGVAVATANLHEKIKQTQTNTWSGATREGVEIPVAQLGELLNRARTQNDEVGIPGLGAVINEKERNIQEAAFWKTVLLTKLKSGDNVIVRDVVDNWPALKKQIPQGLIDDIQAQVTVQANKMRAADAWEVIWNAEDVKGADGLPDMAKAVKKAYDPKFIKENKLSLEQARELKEMATGLHAAQVLEAENQAAPIKEKLDDLANRGRIRADSLNDEIAFIVDPKVRAAISDRKAALINQSKHLNISYAHLGMAKTEFNQRQAQRRVDNEIAVKKVNNIPITQEDENRWLREGGNPKHVTELIEGKSAKAAYLKDPYAVEQLKVMDKLYSSGALGDKKNKDTAQKWADLKDSIRDAYDKGYRGDQLKKFGEDQVKAITAGAFERFTDSFADYYNRLPLVSPMEKTPQFVKPSRSNPVKVNDTYEDGKVYTNSAGKKGKWNAKKGKFEVVNE